LARAGTPVAKVMGIDDISSRRHTYRIVVSDLLRRLPRGQHTRILLLARPQEERRHSLAAMGM
jgi:hypothetical protein